MEHLEAIIDRDYPVHPFYEIPDNADFSRILANFLALSQAFPYLQSASQHKLIFDSIEHNKDVPEHVELTSVVGNFLCWDEMGGFYLMLASGLKGLPRILETRRFHANLLKKDLKAIFNDEIKPEYSDVTRDYLKRLHDGLSNLDPVLRVAQMVAFETHANRMISALWDSLAKNYPVEKNKLSYFYTHVGGEDPAEVYHVEMTSKLVEKLVPEDRQTEFEEAFKKAYAINYDWCKSLTGIKACQN
ncbi:MAG: hypothetical protein ACD_29C00478G0006 [uncultured bacterium]|nr:MAG: hypothetical protein ACD_29C00478G0006 [uncultured bacterium]